MSSSTGWFLHIVIYDGCNRRTVSVAICKIDSRHLKVCFVCHRSVVGNIDSPCKFSTEDVITAAFEFEFITEWQSCINCRKYIKLLARDSECRQEMNMSDIVEIAGQSAGIQRLKIQWLCYIMVHFSVLYSHAQRWVLESNL